MSEKELIEIIVREIVDSPDDVSINVIESEKSTILELQVHPDDVGKVIGKNGRIAQAMRSLLKASAIKRGRRAELQILNDKPE